MNKSLTTKYFINKNPDLMKINYVYIVVLFIAVIYTRCDVNDFFVKGVEEPVLSLNGEWLISQNSVNDIFNEINAISNWKKIRVPGEPMMQGFPIKYDEPFLYKKVFIVPEDYKKNRMKIRFEGVYSYSRVWINKEYVGDHTGGFTPWEYEITDFISPGEENELLVEVTDRKDDISYGSGYALHPIGGILRNVSLIALPKSYLHKTLIITDLDENYSDANLIVSGKIDNPDQNQKIRLRLQDENGKKIKLSNSISEPSGGDYYLENTIKSPLKWNPEHPNLYELTISLIENRRVMWSKKYKVGFREVEVKGNKLYVNGKSVKLRGACRHDIHPLLGRVSTPEYEEIDVMLAKESNMNFIRTSHYPPTENFLKLCDQYGLFVENEVAVCFVGTNRKKEFQPSSSENDPLYTETYLSQVEEMVLEHRNHPSVVIWSLGNESKFGENIRLSHAHLTKLDTTRPVIWSYPGYVPDSLDIYDIISIHYPDLQGYRNQHFFEVDSFTHPDKPVLFDEWAHVPAYNRETLIQDPNVRDFWGLSLDSFWIKTFNSDGGLGGAIWGMIDETFMLPLDMSGYRDWWGIDDQNELPGDFKGPSIGYGEWGIIDTWRRKKPEFWNVKKAYSPIRILQRKFPDHLPENELRVPVWNRFDFTNLNEITLKYKTGNKVFTGRGPDIPPHQKGFLSLNLDSVDLNDCLIIEFLDRQDKIIDIYSISLRDQKKEPDVAANQKPILQETSDEFRIKCQNNLVFSINRQTGLFSSYFTNNEKITFEGPFLNLRSRGKQIRYSAYEILVMNPTWEPQSIEILPATDAYQIRSIGSTPDIKNIEINIKVFSDGRIETEYIIPELMKSFVHEIGLFYIIGGKAESLKWKRDSYWSSYPQGHLASREGQASVFCSIQNKYRTKPEKEWQYDTKSFYYNGVEEEKENELTYIARSSKENILSYHLVMKNKCELTVSGTGSESCRLDYLNENTLLYINNLLDYSGLNWGNYQRNISIDGNFTGSNKFRIHQ
jgi:hypothetical protein